MADFRFIDNSAEAIREKNAAVEAALEAMGFQAETHAKQNITSAGRVDTSAMRNSVNHSVAADEEVVYVGTNIEYAIYHEYGTGIHAEGGRGRQTPWTYKDKKGQWHRTKGMKAIHFLRNAVQDHIDEYKRIAEKYLSRG